MKKILLTGVMCLALFGMGATGGGCDVEESNQEKRDRAVVAEQQSHYGKTQPVPMFDYSLPRDVLIQIYRAVTTEARSTYTIIESMSGETKFHGPSVGYGIPVDAQLTNPMQPVWVRSANSGSAGVTLEQAEPNGLFSSKNTDGTWVLFVQPNGDVTPVYTEHKVTTFPFMMERNDDGEWVRADISAQSSLTVTIKD